MGDNQKSQELTSLVPLKWLILNASWKIDNIAIGLPKQYLIKRSILGFIPLCPMGIFFWHYGRLAWFKK